MTLNDYKAYRQILRPVWELQKARKLLKGSESQQPNETSNGFKHICEVLFILGLMVCAFLILKGCLSDPAWSEPIPQGYTINQWADAIRKSEGNANYGVLAHYKHTSYRQACKNTIIHQYRNWFSVGHPGAFLPYLSKHYAPIGAKNDLTGLNSNWQRNVAFYLQKGTI